MLRTENNFDAYDLDRSTSVVFAQGQNFYLKSFFVSQKLYYYDSEEIFMTHKKFSKFSNVLDFSGTFKKYKDLNQQINRMIYNTNMNQTHAK